jgi:hypothetical protein
MSHDVAECSPTEVRLLFLSRSGIAVRNDDGLGVRLLVGFCDALGATLRTRVTSKGLREWVSLAGPYSFTPLVGELLLPLNRYYKPVGIGGPQWVAYEDFGALAVPAGRLALTHADVVYPERTHGHCREYLYSDRNSPWLDRKCLEAYLKRLVRVVEARP